MGIKTINNAINEMENEMLQLKSQHQKDRELLEWLYGEYRLLRRGVDTDYPDNQYVYMEDKLEEIKKHLEG